MITPTKMLPALRQVRAIIGRTARYKKKLTAVICKVAFSAKEILKPGNLTIISAMIVNRLHISPKIIDNTPHTINFLVSSFLKEIGTARIWSCLGYAASNGHPCWCHRCTRCRSKTSRPVSARDRSPGSTAADPARSRPFQRL